MDGFVKSHERLDDLQYQGLKLIQNPDAFCFGTDAVLLANFAYVRSSDTVIELGTGSGVILLLVQARTGAKKLIGIELQEEMADMASRNISLNNLNEYIEIKHMDLKEAPDSLGIGVADCIICNPPYGKKGASLHSVNDAQRIARHEVCCTLEDCIFSASRLVKNGGRVCFIHQSDRMLELCSLMQKYKLEPKRIRTVQPRLDKAPNLVLIEGIKLGKPGVSWLPTLIIWNPDGTSTEELNQIYHH